MFLLYTVNNNGASTWLGYLLNSLELVQHIVTKHESEWTSDYNNVYSSCKANFMKGKALQE